MVMSHFRPPTLKTTEEEKEALRKEKLRCKMQHLNTGGILDMKRDTDLMFEAPAVALTSKLSVTVPGNICLRLAPRGPMSMM